MSGWLCRLAAARGTTPYSLCAVQLRDNALWARDLDRGVIRRHFAELTIMSGIDEPGLCAMTLMPWIARLSQHYSCPAATAVTPWITVTSVYHRMRRRHALSFCPECLASTGIIQRRWRLAFVVVCERHRRILSDACPHCDAPFVPHRSLDGIGTCHVCIVGKLASTNTGVKGFEAPWVAGVVHLQERMLTCLNDGATAIHTGGCTFEDMRTLVSVFMGSTTPRLTSGTNPESWSLAEPLRSRLEFCRVEVRLGVMRQLQTILRNWPGSFRALTAASSITQRPFSRRTYGPWLEREIKCLPPGNVRSHRSTHSILARRIADLQSQKPANWRALRANLMLHRSEGEQ
jgi:hypothetical protein